MRRTSWLQWQRSSGGQQLVNIAPCQAHAQTGRWHANISAAAGLALLIDRLAARRHCSSGSTCRMADRLAAPRPALRSGLHAYCGSGLLALSLKGISSVMAKQP